MSERKNLKISKKALNVLKGIFIILFILFIILSPGTFFKFLSAGVLASLGFVGFWFLLPIVGIYGFYKILFKNNKKLLSELPFYGFIIFYFFLLIMVSNYMVKGFNFYPFGINSPSEALILDGNVHIIDNVEVNGYLEMNSSLYYLSQIINDENIGISTSSFSSNVYLGGGFVGFIFAGIFNSLFKGIIGTTILSIIMMVVGLILIFFKPIKEFVISLKKRNKKRTKETNDEDYEEEIGEEKSKEVPALFYKKEELSLGEINIEKNAEPISFSSSFNMNNLNFATSNSNSTLKKAVYISENNEANNLIIEEQKEEDVSSIKPSRSLSFGEINPYENSRTIKEEKINVVPSFLESHNEEIIEEKVETNNEINNDIIEIKNNIDTQNVNNIEPKQNFVRPSIEKVIATNIEKKAKLPYVLPPISLLNKSIENPDDDVNASFCENRIEEINRIFKELSIGASITGYTIGPTVTQYDLAMNSDRSISTIDKFIPDLQIRLGGIPVRFEKLVVGKSTSALEMENAVRTTVTLRECIENLPPINEKSQLTFAFGKGISGNVLYEDLRKFPHMLVAGTTGSGKSIFIHSLLITLLMRNSPEDLRLLLIDPKRVEMNFYKNIPHLICPNISEAKKAYIAMQKLVDEMEKRYTTFSDNMVSDIKDYNKIAPSKGLEKMPYIVVIIDEYADLNEECKEIRGPVCRIAQKARSAGIHLVVATQRPSVNVIDGVIKANISTHVALSVSSQEDSRVIMGEIGAEKLLGNGDMLIDSSTIRTYKPRVQGSFVDNSEILKVTDFIRSEQEPVYFPEFLDLEDHSDEKEASEYIDNEPTKVSKEIQEEELFDIIKMDLMSKDYCSISYIQRSYGVGFPKAGRLFARLQKEGYIARTGDSSHGCKVLIKAEENKNLGSIEQSTLVVSEDE